MENLFAILSIPLILFICYHIRRFWKNQKKLKGLSKVWHNTKIATPFLLGVFVTVPLTLWLCIRQPMTPIKYGTSMAWVGTKVMWRVHKLDYKLGIFLAPYTPWLGKKIVKGTKTAYNESGARDTQRIMADVVNPVGIKVYKPKPTLFARILDGIAGIGKVFI